MKFSLSTRLACTALCLAAAFTSAAAAVPPGVQLHPTQMLVRNNGTDTIGVISPIAKM